MKYRSDQSSRAFRRIFYDSCPMVLFSTAFLPWNISHLKTYSEVMA